MNTSTSSWLNDSTFEAVYDVNISSEFVENIDIAVNGAFDTIGNPQLVFQALNAFTIDTKSPNVVQLSTNIDTISLSDIGTSTFVLTAMFDEVMDL